MEEVLYFDHAASTAVHPDVVAEILPYFTTQFANSESRSHVPGLTAASAVNSARTRIAHHLGTSPEEITFTSGATESINIALQGIYERYSPYGKHIIVAKTEHKAVLDTVAYLEKKGAEVSYIGTDINGEISVRELKNMIRKDTVLLAIMWVNNETGVFQNIGEISNLAHEHKIAFFSDLTQGIGKFPLQLSQLPIAAAAFSGHKIGAPKGVGILYLSRKNPRVQCAPITFGGNQENGMRPGTLNVPGIIGIAKALDTVDYQDIKRIEKYHTQLIEFFSSQNCRINTSSSKKSPFILNITGPENCKARDLFKKNPRIAFSLGSACTSSSLKNSHVLLGMGLSDQEAERSFRLSINWSTSQDEIDFLIRNFKF